jgi:hypothetical protein
MCNQRETNLWSLTILRYWVIQPVIDHIISSVLPWCVQILSHTVDSALLFSDNIWRSQTYSLG